MLGPRLVKSRAIHNNHVTNSPGLFPLAIIDILQSALSSKDIFQTLYVGILEQATSRLLHQIVFQSVNHRLDVYMIVLNRIFSEVSSMWYDNGYAQNRLMIIITKVQINNFTNYLMF